MLIMLGDRVQPMCGWCSRNGYACEYKERKKPGLRAGMCSVIQASDNHAAPTC